SGESAQSRSTVGRPHLLGHSPPVLFLHASDTSLSRRCRSPLASSATRPARPPAGRPGHTCESKKHAHWGLGDFARMISGCQSLPPARAECYNAGMTPKLYAALKWGALLGGPLAILETLIAFNLVSSINAPDGVIAFFAQTLLKA